MITIPLIIDGGSITVPPDPDGVECIRKVVDVPNGEVRFYLEGDEDIPSDPEPEAPRNWAMFRLGMLADPAFLRVVEGGKVIHQASLASEINQNPPNEPSVHAVRLVWNTILEGLAPEHLPTESEITAWQGLAAMTNVPLTFDSDGKLL